MKLPNGYGSVCKLSRNRRKPYIVRISDGFTSEGKLIRKTIGYTKTKEEGLALLAEYHKSPWDTDKTGATVQDVFELWKGHNNLAPKTFRSYENRYKNYCHSIANLPYKDLRTYHFKEILDNCKYSNATKNNIRKVFRVLDKTALEYDIITKSYAELIPSFEVVDSSSRKPFTESEIKKVWKYKDIPNMDLVLLLLYTGFRIGEFSDLLIENIDLEEDTITGGAKTKAGKNRKVPIHPKIREMLISRIDGRSNGKLFKIGDKSIREKFKACMNELGLNHSPHECRHTVETRLDNAGGNRKCIDLILGHTSNGTGQRVYNHKTIEQLKETIRLLK